VRGFAQTGSLAGTGGTSVALRRMEGPFTAGREPGVYAAVAEILIPRRRRFPHARVGENIRQEACIRFDGGWFASLEVGGHQARHQRAKGIWRTEEERFQALNALPERGGRAGAPLRACDWPKQSSVRPRKPMPWLSLTIFSTR